MNIPKSITKNLCVSIGIGKYNKGEISVSDYDGKGCDGMERVTIYNKEVTFEIPDVDVTGKAISLIEDKKSALQELFHKEVSALDQQIQELRALPAPEAEE